MRGLNVMEATPQIPLNSDRKDSEDRTVGSYQQDQFKAHEHVYREVTSGGGSAAGGSGAGLTEKSTSGGGGAETRPKNIAVYYYIRIN